MSENNFNFDMDGDGIMDSYADPVDINGDGIVDVWMVDMDNDGTADIMLADIDSDGVPDAYVHDLLDTDNDGYYDTMYGSIDGEEDMSMAGEFIDTDGDGSLDTVTYGLDTNHDGVFDQVLVNTDTDGDGSFDYREVTADTNYDGITDYSEIAADTDGDNIFDTNVQSNDYDGDGVFEDSTTYHDSDGDGVFDSVESMDYDEVNIESAGEPVYENEYSDDFENFDPDSADMDNVSGDPGADMENWESQGNTNRCALYSQKFVIESLTGEDIDIEELADIAEENGWFTEEGGTAHLNINKMLDYYEIDNDMSFNNDIDDIKECLDNGGKVIVVLDADEIWYGDADDLFDPSSATNHAVQVIGIDYSDPDNPMVILNDSGHPDGCGSMIPMDVFEDAWQDGNCQMVTCM